MTKEWMTKEWNPEDDGYWEAGCVLCRTHSPMLPTPEDCSRWATAHFADKHPDRIGEGDRMTRKHFFPGPRWLRKQAEEIDP